MAFHLIRAGYELHVFDVNQKAMDELQAAGALVAGSPQQLALSCDTVIAMLPDSPQVADVAFGKEGLLSGLRPGVLFIDMSTIDAATEQEIQQRFAAAGSDALDAPVSGGERGAIDATLSIMVGGQPAAFQRALPIFQVLGKRISYMGTSGAGQITKSCSQIATALATQGVIEALTLARRAGVDLSKVREALLGGFAESKALAVAGDKMIREDFTPGFTLKLYNKDLRIAERAAAKHSLALPGTTLLVQEMTDAVAQGKGGLDFSALIQLFEN